jgi:hypothetical protein
MGLAGATSNLVDRPGIFNYIIFSYIRDAACRSHGRQRTRSRRGGCGIASVGILARYSRAPAGLRK